MTGTARRVLQSRCARVSVLAPTSVLAHLVAALVGSPAALAANPVQVENAKPGDSYWMAATQDPSSSAIEGYATATSVRPGDSIGFHVSTNPAARYRIEIDRLGWYGGSGGRRVACLVRAALDASCSQDELGVQQPAAPAPDPVTGEVDAGWSVTDRLSVPADWTSGYYLAVFRLTSGPSAGQTGYTPFIVQAPVGDHAAILVQVPANTWQAYNTWGGEDLYTSPRAVKVSFNRPYALEGAAAVGAGRGGGLFEWEYPLVRFLERTGWDVSYTTDDDVDRDPRILLHHALDMTAGHGEYWTKQMRDGWEAAQSAGVNLAFMGANAGYWQIRYEDNDRTIVSYKTSPDPDPDPTDKTVQFRQLSAPRPECQLEGVQFAGTVLYRNYLDYSVDVSDPWFAGTGLTTGSVLPGLVGYETDAVDPTCHVPPVTPLLTYSSPPANPGGPPARADSVRYRACSGAEVFSAGSLQFSWGLDSWRDPRYSAPGFPPLPPASPGLQQAMTQALGDLTQRARPYTWTTRDLRSNLDLHDFGVATERRTSRRFHLDSDGCVRADRGGGLGPHRRRSFPGSYRSHRSAVVPLSRPVSGRTSGRRHQRRLVDDDQDDHGLRVPSSQPLRTGYLAHRRLERDRMQRSDVRQPHDGQGAPSVPARSGHRPLHGPDLLDGADRRRLRATEASLCVHRSRGYAAANPGNQNADRHRPEHSSRWSPDRAAVRARASPGAAPADTASVERHRLCWHRRSRSDTVVRAAPVIGVARRRDRARTRAGDGGPSRASGALSPNPGRARQAEGAVVRPFTPVARNL